MSRATRWMGRALGHQALPYAVVVLCFVLSRYLYRSILGARFDVSALAFFIQYAPVELLKHDLASTVWHLHHQSPIPNLLVGAAFAAVPSAPYVLLDAMNVALGLGMALALLATAKRLGVGPLVRTIGTVAFTANPFTALFELWLFYHYLVAALLVFAVLALLHYFRSPTLARGAAFFTTLALVAFTRSIYGALWIGVAAGLLLLVEPRRWRTTLLAATLPLALVVALGAKTQAQTGGSFGEAMLWPNLATKIFWKLPMYERRRLLDEGQVSQVHHDEPFSRLSSFEARGAKLERPATGVPLFDDIDAGGQWNKHHLGYLELAQRYYHPDARYLFARYLGTYQEAVVDSLWVHSMRPSTFDIYLSTTPNRARLQRVEALAVDMFGGKTKAGQLRGLLVLAPLTILFGLWTLLRARSLLPSQRATRGVIAFATMTIGYTTLGTTMVSYADHCRYRFDVDGLYMMLWMVMASRMGALALRRFRALGAKRRVTVAAA